MYRQGDVLLIPIDAVSANRGKAQPRDQRGRIVLAEGEATGHAHVITAGGARLYGEHPDGRVLSVLEKGGVELTHEEHASIHLSPGAYRVIRQRQWLYEESFGGVGRAGWVRD